MVNVLIPLDAPQQREDPLERKITIKSNRGVFRNPGISSLNLTCPVHGEWRFALPPYGVVPAQKCVKCRSCEYAIMIDVPKAYVYLLTDTSARRTLCPCSALRRLWAWIVGGLASLYS